MRAREPESFWRENVIAVVMSFSKKMEVAEISYQEIEVLSFWDRERALPPLIIITVLPFLVEKRTMKFSALESFFRISRKNLMKTRPRCHLKVCSYCLYLVNKLSQEFNNLRRCEVLDVISRE